MPGQYDRVLWSSPPWYCHSLGDSLAYMDRRHWGSYDGDPTCCRLTNVVRDERPRKRRMLSYLPGEVASTSKPSIDRDGITVLGRYCVLLVKKGRCKRGHGCLRTYLFSTCEFGSCRWVRNSAFPCSTLLASSMSTLIWSVAPEAPKQSTYSFSCSY